MDCNHVGIFSCHLGSHLPVTLILFTEKSLNISVILQLYYIDEFKRFLKLQRTHVLFF